MTTRMHQLAEDSEDREILYDQLLSVYLDGECYAFAIALHRGLAWPIVGLMEDLVPRHVVVRMPSGMLRDVRGKEFTADDPELGAPFSLTPPYVLQEIHESNLFVVRKIQDHSIALARSMAERLWPDLGWKNPLEPRVRAFVDALEMLCKEHGFCIRSPYVTTRPIISPLEGDEGGFDVFHMPHCTDFTFDRYLSDT